MVNIRNSAIARCERCAHRGNMYNPKAGETPAVECRRFPTFVKRFADDWCSEYKDEGL